MSSGKQPAQAASDVPQDIEALKSRYEKLKTRKTVAETNLANAQRQLEDLRKKARDTYDTDDLEQLRAKLAAMERENTQRRADYQESLNRIEADLKALETKYQQDAPQDGAA